VASSGAAGSSIELPDPIFGSLIESAASTLGQASESTEVALGHAR
jgi:hypothetical protein